jgi:hypothetical protein
MCKLGEAYVDRVGLKVLSSFGANGAFFTQPCLLPNVNDRGFPLAHTRRVPTHPQRPSRVTNIFLVQAFNRQRHIIHSCYRGQRPQGHHSFREIPCSSPQSSSYLLFLPCSPQAQQPIALAYASHPARTIKRHMPQAMRHVRQTMHRCICPFVKEPSPQH